MPAPHSATDPAPPAPTESDSPSQADLLAAIESRLVAHLDAPPDPPEPLIAAARYAVLGGGKRLRPLLCLRSALAAGGKIEDALDAACAVEFVHAFSLVHDDLPALDNDDMRRGRATVHKAFGEAIAVLAGDFLMAVAAQAAAASPIDAARSVSELLAATNEMIFGQIHDTLGGTDPDLPAAEQLRRIHARKTGALITSACRLGGIAAGADGPRLEALDRFGRVIGQMFQAVDDLLDETQTSQHLGKAAGKDRDAGKLTYPRVHGLEETRRLVAEMREEAIRALEGFDEAAAPLRQLVEDLAVRTR